MKLIQEIQKITEYTSAIGAGNVTKHLQIVNDNLNKLDGNVQTQITKTTASGNSIIAALIAIESVLKAGLKSIVDVVGIKGSGQSQIILPPGFHQSDGKFAAEIARYGRVGDRLNKVREAIFTRGTMGMSRALDNKLEKMLDTGGNKAAYISLLIPAEILRAFTMAQSAVPILIGKISKLTQKGISAAAGMIHRIGGKVGDWGRRMGQGVSRFIYAGASILSKKINSALSKNRLITALKNAGRKGGGGFSGMKGAFGKLEAAKDSIKAISMFSIPEIKSQLGDASKAYTDFKNKFFGSFKNELSYLNNAITKVLKVVGDFITSSNPLAVVIRYIIFGIIVLATILVPVIAIVTTISTVITMMSSVWTILGIVMNFALGPIGLIILGILAVIGVIILIVAYFDEIKAAIASAIEWLINLFKGFTWLKIILALIFLPIILLVGAFILLWKGIAFLWGKLKNFFSWSGSSDEGQKDRQNAEAEQSEHMLASSKKVDKIGPRAKPLNGNIHHRSESVERQEVAITVKGEKGAEYNVERKGRELPNPNVGLNGVPA